MRRVWLLRCRRLFSEQVRLLSTDGGQERLGKQRVNVLTLIVKDENLKNIMMSWYYAGYYTGLHAGQQQGPPDTKQ
jgi:hypothetical protein